MVYIKLAQTSLAPMNMPLFLLTLMAFYVTEQQQQQKGNSLGYFKVDDVWSRDKNARNQCCATATQQREKERRRDINIW